MAKEKFKIKREAIFLLISVILSIGVLAGTISSLGFLANEVTNALNPNLSGTTQYIKYDIKGFDDLKIGQ